MLNQHGFFNRHQLPGCFRACNYKRQSGAVLVISLVMLLLLTLIGTTSMQTTSLEEKMVGNMREQNIAFQAAESALRAGEAATAIALPFTCAGTGGFYDSTTATACPQPPNWQTIDWTDANSIVTYSGGSIRSFYYIEQLDPVAGVSGGFEAGAPESGGGGGSTTSTSWYRITARGTGNTDNAVVWLQSTYTR